MNKLIEQIINNNSILTEWKSVSDEVRNIVPDIIDVILHDSRNKEKKINGVQGFGYVENEDGFKYTVTLNGKSKDITIKYVLYLFKTEDECNHTINGFSLDKNNSWDENTQTLEIISGLVNGQASDNFKEVLEHEVEHMFEYEMGLQKRVDLYDKTLEMVGRGQNNIRGYFVAFALYYTFPHEQNAFKQQFYIYLTNLKRKIDFDEALENFTPYKQMDNAYDAVYDHYDNKEEIRAINELGYSRKQYFKRLYFGYNRFIRKLKNVYERWFIENKSSFMTKESVFRHTINIMSKKFELSEGKNFREKEKNLPIEKFEFFYL